MADLDEDVLRALNLHPKTRALLAAIRDLHELREWLRSGEPADLTELASKAERVREAQEVWCDDGCPDAPPSVEELSEGVDSQAIQCSLECLAMEKWDSESHHDDCPNKMSGFLSGIVAKLQGPT